MAVGSAVLWDLDGTLTNSSLGITRSMQFVMTEMGFEAAPSEVLRRFIGPPIHITLAHLIGSEEPAMVDRAVTLYRQRYGDVGKLENEAIAGVPEALLAVADSGVAMFVATSKLESYSIEIVEHFGLSRFFRTVYGSQLDGGRADKGELIQYIVARENLDPRQCVMIGDRMHDIVGAAKNDMASIGVLWGFGDRAELERAGATVIAGEPRDLPGLVERLLD